MIETLDESRLPTWRIWLLGMVVVAATLPPIFVSIGNRDLGRIMEDLALLSSQETWLRQRGYIGVERDADAWLLPSIHGRPRVNKPPMLVWLNLLAWSDLDPATATDQQLISRARLVAAGCFALLVASTFAIGYFLAGWRLASIAGLALGTFLFVQRQGRSCTYDIEYVAFATAAIAFGVWVITSSKPARWRWWLGWSLCGAWLAASLLTKGPLALAVVLVPLVIMLLPGSPRWHGLVGLLWAAAVCVMLAAPWYVHVRSVLPHLFQTSMHEYQAIRDQYQPPWFYAGIFVMVLPWSIWLAAGLVQPFAAGADALRRRRFVCWLWFIAILVMFSLPGAKSQRYILPIMPAAALLIAQVFVDHENLSRTGRKIAGLGRVLWPHHLGLIGASVLLPLAMILPLEQAKALGLADRLLPMSPLIAGGYGLVLLMLALLGLKVHRTPMPHRAAVLTGLWMIVASTVFWFSYDNAPASRMPYAAEARKVMLKLGDQPLGYYAPDSAGERALLDNEEFLCHIRRVVMSVDPADPAWRGDLLAADSPRNDQYLTSQGWIPVIDVTPDLATFACRLWRRGAARD